MTDAQKDILISKMLDSAATLTDEEISLINSDEELRDILNTSSRVASSLAPEEEYDVVAEWKSFSRLLRPRPSSTRWIMRVAAIFMGVVIAGGLIVRLTDRIFQPASDDHVTVYTELRHAVPDTSVRAPQQDSALVPDLSIPSHSAHSPSPQTPSTLIAQLSRIDDATQIEIDEILTLTQARIDNDLALQTARLAREEYLASLHDVDTHPDRDYEEYLDYVTME